MAARRKPSMLLPELLKKRMFLLLLFVYMIVAYFGIISFKENTTPLALFTTISWISYMVGYLALALLKVNTKVVLSILHLVALLLIFVITTYTKINNTFIWIFWIITWMFFILNLILSVRKK